MNEQTHHVEAHLGDMGKKCNTRLLEKKGNNLKTWEREIGAAGAYAPVEFNSQEYRLYSFEQEVSGMPLRLSLLCVADVLRLSRGF